jgi:hypothetical protein
LRYGTPPKELEFVMQERNATHLQATEKIISLSPRTPIQKERLSSFYQDLPTGNYLGQMNQKSEYAKAIRERPMLHGGFNFAWDSGGLPPLVWITERTSENLYAKMTVHSEDLHPQKC